MSVCLRHGQDNDGYQEVHPLVRIYMERLSELVGFLSRFIVQKQCQGLRCDPTTELDEESAMLLCRGILSEVQVLVGPMKSIELETELLSMTKEYYNGGSGK